MASPLRSPGITVCQFFTLKEFVIARHLCDSLIPHLAGVLTRPLRWDLVEQQYDEMIKLAVGLKDGTPTADAILKRLRTVIHSSRFANATAGHATTSTREWSRTKRMRGHSRAVRSAGCSTLDAEWKTRDRGHLA